MIWKTEKRRVNDLLPYVHNPRKMSEKQMKALQDCLTQFGLVEIPVINLDGTLIAGHQRCKAMQLLNRGGEEIDVRIPDIMLTEAELKEYNVASNAIKGDWLQDVLKEHYKDIDLGNYGLDMKKLDAEIKFMEKYDKVILTAEDDDFDSENENKKTDIVLGDIIEIGNHRLICGDNRLADNYTKLFEGKKAVLMVTDPPYGVKYDPTWRSSEDHFIHGKIKSKSKVLNDDIADWKDTYSMFDGDVVYIWHGSLSTHTVAQNIIDCGYDLISHIIWNKPCGAISRGDIHWKHEACWYAVKKGKKHNWQGQRNVWSVWDIQNGTARNVIEREGQSGHGTQKPLECMSRPIMYNSVEGDLVYDPFLGSGTTMVAAEQLNRICFGFELDPIHCQMIVDRMKKFFEGIDIKINGKAIANIPS